MPDMMVWVWLAVLAAAALIESLTAALVSVWFAVGALAACIAAFAGATAAAQALLFIAVSIAVWAAARPLAKKYIDPRRVPTNVDRLLGAQARVTEDVSADSGAARADGKTWTARSADGAAIPAGETAEIVAVEGVKLILRPEAAREVPQP